MDFEIQNFKEDQKGVDEATDKLTNILHKLSENSCYVRRKSFRKYNVKKKQPLSDNSIVEMKHQINVIGSKIRLHPYDDTYKISLLKVFF